MSRVHLTANHDVGLLIVGEGSEVEGEDVVIERTESNGEGLFGRALEVNRAGSVMLNRALVRENRDSSLYLGGEGTSVRLENLVVKDTTPAACATEPPYECPYGSRSFGDGILAIGGVDLRLTDFYVIDNARIGLYLFDPAGTPFEEFGIVGNPMISASRGELTRNGYGINLYGEGLTPSLFSESGLLCHNNLIKFCWGSYLLEVPTSTDIPLGR